MFFLGLALALLQCPLPAGAAQRVNTYTEALNSAGRDGVIVYCYGPDWNKRSMRMLDSFWKRAELEAAAGDAKLVAVPFYQSKDKDTAESVEIRGGLERPPFGVCPTVLMIDATGRIYSKLVGSDYLGDESGELGISNIKEKLAALHKQQELMEKAESASGPDKAKLISDACDLGIEPPPNAVELIEAADPEDSSGAVRRQKFDALQFMYEQLDTKDGFLAPDFVADLDEMRKACMAIAQDQAYKEIDRQKAMNLYIGQSRRDYVPPPQLKTLINQNIKIDGTTPFGRLLPTLVDLWGNATRHLSSDERRKLSERKKAAKEQKKKKLEEQKEKKRRERKARRNLEISSSS